jgi:hypothetical protein
MKTLAFSLIMLVSLAAPGGSQDHATPSDRTWGIVNGRWWKAVSAEIRIGFVQGYGIGHSLAVAEGPRCTEGEWFKGDPSNGEVRAALDKFYEEPANASIAVTDAIEIVALKFNGRTGSQIELETTLHRKASTMAPESKKP